MSGGVSGAEASSTATTDFADAKAMMEATFAKAIKQNAEITAISTQGNTNLSAVKKQPQG